MEARDYINQAWCDAKKGSAREIVTGMAWALLHSDYTADEIVEALLERAVLTDHLGLTTAYEDFADELDDM